MTDLQTREQLLDAFAARLNGHWLRADAYKHPFTKDWIQRFPQRKDPRIDNQVAPQAKIMPDNLSAIIEVEESPDGTYTLEKHVAFYSENGNNKGNVQFFVENRGRESEDAWWLGGNEPKPEPKDPSFQQVVLEWLRGKVGTIVGGYLVKHVASATADQDAQTATARILAEESGATKWIDVFLSRDAEGNVQFEIIPDPAA